MSAGNIDQSTRITQMIEAERERTRIAEADAAALAEAVREVWELVAPDANDESEAAHYGKAIDAAEDEDDGQISVWVPFLFVKHLREALRQHDQREVTG